MPNAYHLRDVPVLEGAGTANRLIVHMCHIGGINCVEFFVDGSTVVMTREAFDNMAHWVNQQFSNLKGEIPVAH